MSQTNGNILNCSQQESIQVNKAKKYKFPPEKNDQPYQISKNNIQLNEQQMQHANGQSDIFKIQIVNNSVIERANIDYKQDYLTNNNKENYKSHLHVGKSQFSSQSFNGNKMPRSILKNSFAKQLKKKQKLQIQANQSLQNLSLNSIKQTDNNQNQNISQPQDKNSQELQQAYISGSQKDHIENLQISKQHKDSVESIVRYDQRGNKIEEGGHHNIKFAEKVKVNQVESYKKYNAVDGKEVCSFCQLF